MRFAPFLLGFVAIALAVLVLRMSDQVADPRERRLEGSAVVSGEGEVVIRNHAAPAPGTDASGGAGGPDTADTAVRMPRVRAVAPDIVPVPPPAEGTLERIAPREPLGGASPHQGAEPEVTLLHRPHAVAAGLFQAQGHTVRLAGIEVPDAGLACVSDGVSWPCGAMARTAFRNWLRGRALTCQQVPATPEDEPLVTDCSLGRQDAAGWLVTQGWALARPGSAYGEQQAAAERERRGMFGSGPEAD